MDNKIPITEEEFFNLVKEDFRTSFGISDDKIEEYFASDETKEVIRSRYEHDCSEFQKGEITEAIFRHGAVYSVSYCLWLMY